MKWFSEKLLAIGMINTEGQINKPFYLGLSLLDMTNRVMYECWCDYTSPKYGDKTRLFYTDTDTCTAHAKLECI